MNALAAAASSELFRPITRQAEEAFWAYPHVFMAFVSVGLAALLVAGFWLLRGAGKATSATRQALRAQALKRQKDHRALVLVGNIDAGNGRLRDLLMAAIETHFAAFAFQAPIQVEPFPIKLKIVPAKAHPEKIRRVAVQAADVLERSAGDVMVWGRRGVGDKVELRIVSAPGIGRSPETHVIEFRLKGGHIPVGVEEAIAYACARRARPILNRPHDYKPEKLQPIVEALDSLVNDPPPTLSEAAQLEIVDDFARGALSLGERGGGTHWLEKALDARRQYLDRVDRTVDPGAWGAAQQEVGRALAALGEREGARDKLEEAVSVLKVSLDALRATDSLQNAEVAMRALQRAEQTLAQRRRIGLRWPA
jgi:tetratricopeptide (TPR) repeat protein